MSGIRADRCAPGQCPLWVISCRSEHLAPRPLYPRKLSRLSPTVASALGQEETHAVQQKPPSARIHPRDNAYCEKSS